MSNVRWMPDNAVMQRLAKYAGAVVGAAALSAALGASLVMSAAPAWAQATYNATGVPATLSSTDSPATTYNYEIVVADDFDINDVSLSINFFGNSASYTDLFLIGPDQTKIELTSYSCRSGPVVWGTRTYLSPNETELDTGVPDPANTALIGPEQDVSGGVAATYRFADGGIRVGQAGEAGTACEIYYNAIYPNGATWPSTGSEAGNVGQVGGYITLPASTVYSPEVGNFSDFNGKAAKGTWVLQIVHYPGTQPWTTADLKINSISLNFNGGTTFSGKKAARAMVQNFMASRASRLLSDDLELKDVLKKKPKPTDRNALQNLNVADNQITSARTNMFSLGMGGGNGDQSGTFSVWAKSSYQRSENPSGDADGVIGHVGLTYQPNVNTAVGILVTMDRVQQKGEEISGAIGAKVEGTGWLVGPYVVAKLDKRLTFTGRAQMGASDNTYKFSYGSWDYAGAFETKRVLVKAELAGETQVGRWLLEPAIKFGYTKDKSKGAVAIWSRAYGYDDIGQVDVSEGRVELAQKVSYPINAGRFTFVPSLKVSGIWKFDSPDYMESISADGDTIVTSDEQLAAKVEAALKLTDEDSGAHAGVSIFYEGANSSNDAFGISLRGKIPLNK